MNETPALYAQIARYYDLTHDKLTEDIPFILSQAGKPPANVLELGSGTGRLALPLLKAGHRVTGVENSAEMLARARARLATLPRELQGRAAFYEQDMTALALPPDAPHFDLALLPYNTAMHLTPPQLGQTLRQVKKVLRENGRFLIDVANPFTVAATPNDRMLTLENVLVDPENGDTVLQMAANWLDEAAQLLHVTWIYEASPTTGGPVIRTIAQFAYHFLYPHQWQMILADAGLHLWQLLGDYEQNPFSEESDRLLLHGGMVPNS